MKKIGAFAVIILGIILIPFCARAEGTRIQTYQSAGYRIYDVTSYGADASGVTDSFTAVKKALRACEKKPGGVLYFPNGRYLLYGQIVCKKSVSIVAEDESEIYGKGEKIVCVKSSKGTLIVNGGTWVGEDVKGTGIYAATGSKVRLENLNIRNAGIGLKAYFAKVFANNCTFNKNSNCGVAIYGTTQAEINNSIISGNGNGYPNKADKGHGIGVYDNAYLKIKNSTVEKSNQCGISLVSTNIKVQNCMLRFNGRHGIGTRGACTISVKGTTFQHNGYRKSNVVFGNHGMIVVDGSKAVLNKCTFIQNKNQGIWVNNDKSVLIARKCTFDQNGRTPIGLYSDRGRVKAVIGGCTFKNSQDGLQVTLVGKGRFQLDFLGKNTFLDMVYLYRVDQNGTISYEFS